MSGRSQKLDKPSGKPSSLMICGTFEPPVHPPDSTAPLTTDPITPVLPAPETHP